LVLIVYKYLHIVVDVEKGGRSLIRVSDNGTGMGHDDALLALERYATSKIFKDRDLFSINTLGFRGEAPENSSSGPAVRRGRNESLLRQELLIMH